MAPNNEHNHYDTNQYAGDQATNTRRVMNHMPDEDRSSREEIQQHINSSQAAELAPAVRMGDDRVIGDTPNWDGRTSQELYDAATQNNSPTTADDLGRAFNDGGNSLAEAANGLFDAVSRLDGAWSGVAADSAKAALAPLASAAGLAGQTAQMMGVQMSAQSVAATEVRKLPPPEEFDQQQSLQAMATGGPLAMQQDLKAQKDAADAVKREQIAYLNAYTASMSSVDAQTPSFVPPKETIGGGDSGRTPIIGGRVDMPATLVPFDHGTTTGSPSGGYSGIGAPGGADGWPGDDQNGGGDGLTPLPGVGSGTGAAGYNPGGTGPSTTPTTFGPGGGAGGVHAGGPGAGAGGFGGGFGNFGGSGGAGGGAGVPGANSGGNGPAGPKGMVPGAGGAGGRGGAGGGMGSPRGKGKGEDDDEHERPSYLVEGDPESAFGSDQLTAPSVIGGDDD